MPLTQGSLTFFEFVLKKTQASDYYNETVTQMVLYFKII